LVQAGRHDQRDNSSSSSTQHLGLGLPTQARDKRWWAGDPSRPSPATSPTPTALRLRDGTGGATRMKRCRLENVVRGDHPGRRLTTRKTPAAPAGSSRTRQIAPRGDDVPKPRCPARSYLKPPRDRHGDYLKQSGRETEKELLPRPGGLDDLPLWRLAEPNEGRATPSRTDEAGPDYPVLPDSGTEAAMSVRPQELPLAVPVAGRNPDHAAVRESHDPHLAVAFTASGSRPGHETKALPA
jgi:hypothetical protein